MSVFLTKLMANQCRDHAKMCGIVLAWTAGR
jgi:hypothetical protein